MGAFYARRGLPKWRALGANTPDRDTASVEPSTSAGSPSWEQQTNPTRHTRIRNRLQRASRTTGLPGSVLTIREIH